MTLRPTLTRWILIALGVLLLAFGLACTNFTKPDALQYHQQWAEENDMPGPTSAVSWAGFNAAAVGAFLIGLSFAVRGSAS
jgi:cytochrome c biogenesis protein CcdA